VRRIRVDNTKDELCVGVERVSKGEEFMMRRRGQEAAKVAPAGQRSTRAPRDVAEHIRQSRKGAHLPAGYTLRRLIEEGRRS